MSVRGEAPGAATTAATTMPVAVIVPVLHDADALGRLLEAIDTWPAAPREVIVVAGSADDAVERLCASRGHRCIHTPPNRGMQLDIGARAAAAPVLWFVHADTAVPPQAIVDLAASIDSGAESGCFAFEFQGPRTATKRLLERGVALRVRCGGTCYGDQALFATRAAYDACGGFAHEPLFEEAPLVRRLRRRGTFRPLPVAVGVSTRRWDRDGWWRRSLHNRWLALCYMLGVPAAKLAGAYARRRDTDRPEATKPPTP